MTAQLIVLNGGSSSGKSGVARCLQAVLPDPWLAVGVDTLIEAMPASMQTSDAGIEVASDGRVSVGPVFRTLQAAWMEGVAAMAYAGARVIVDEVFLGGAVSQQRWQKVLGELDVLWVGVRCESAVAAGREIARGDRSRGWLHRRRTWSTRACSMTWRWTPRTPSPWSVRGLSPLRSGDGRLGCRLQERLVRPLRVDQEA